MDRFIDNKAAVMYIWQLFKIQYGQIYRCERRVYQLLSQSLKSNMDRFIALQTLIDIQQYFCLKSNMDRFIGY